ncbi:MAG: DNA helicase RecG, partial [Abditibacteriota bacterium]|nr:DNA helicase RecG [Abditibacteriota bacterium]
MRSADKQRLDSQVQFVKGVGPRYAKLLAKLNIYTIRDLLFHFPRRYEDRRSFASVGQLRGGERVTVKGRVADVELVPTRSRMTILKVYIDDGTGSLSLTFFNQPWNKEKFVKLRGKEVIAYGEVKLGRFCPEMLSPEWELCGSGEDSIAAIVPIYPATEGLMETRLRKLSRDAVERCSG